MYSSLSNFNFQVEWGGSRTEFMEVTGLGTNEHMVQRPGHRVVTLVHEGFPVLKL